MSYESGLISAPVSFADVNSALGTRHTDLGNLCKDNNIKMWAKYKPVVKDLIVTTDQLDSNKQWKSSSTWWKGTNGNCGITYNSYTTIASAKSAIDTGRVVWSYTKPSGTSSSPYRLTDFNQYFHNAEPPTTALFATDAINKAGATMYINAIPSADHGLEVKLYDVGSFDNFYYLAAVYDSNGTLVFLHTSSKKVGQYEEGEAISIEIPYNNGTYGYEGRLTENATYYAYMLLSSLPYTMSTNPLSGTYVPLPTNGGSNGMPSSSFKCYGESGPALNATVEGYTLGATSLVCNWNVTIWGTLNPTQIEIRLKYTSNNQQIESKTINFSSRSVAVTGGYKRQSFGVSEAFTLPDTDYYKYYLEVYYNGLTAKGNIRQDIIE